MLELFGLLFGWLPSGFGGIAIAFICIFVLVFFVGIIIRILKLF